MPKRLGETSYKETAFGILPREKLIPLEIEGIKRAWDFVLHERSKHKIPLTPAMLQKIHFVGFAWIFPGMGGKFRRVNVTVSNHTPPSFYEIQQHIKNFCDDLHIRLQHLSRITEAEDIDKLIELLAWAHHRFLWIHPFQDYNGRIGRLLINIILLNLDLPVVELKVETTTGRKRYIKALQFADKHQFELLQKLIKQALEESVQSI